MVKANVIMEKKRLRHTENNGLKFQNKSPITNCGIIGGEYGDF